MEQIKELEEVLELLNTKQYTKLRQYLAELNDADIAGLLEELEEEDMLKVFRILPKDLAADVFSYLDMDNQQKIITSLSDKEATNIINNLMADDAADLLEEMPANIVKKLLTNASPEVRRDINHLLRYPEDSAGSIMTVEYVDLKENLTVNQAIERIRKVGLDSETINICYVLDAQRRLVGTVALRYLLLMDGDEIIGFIPDIKFASFRQEVTPMAFYLWGKYQWGQEGNYYNIAYVKFKAGSNLRAGMEHVRESLEMFDSEYPFVVRFYDEVLQHTYEKELKIGSLITLFSLVAIFISIVGVFGLVVFESEYRRKEIAVRKVLGSTTGEILYMFNVNYFWILLVCFLLGAPVAWYGVHRWLENFAYRTPMYWWVLPLAFLVVGVITVLTVTFQNWHVANENPVKNIKSE